MENNLTLATRANALMPSREEWALITHQASVLLKSGFLPEAIKTAEQAIAIAIKGRELGMPMMWSYANIYLIKNKTGITSEGMLGLVYKNCPTASINYLSTTDDECIIEAARNAKSPKAKFSFNMHNAKSAGLLGKENWQKYPAAMLRARCVAAMARAIFPDAIMGCYTPDELGEVVNEDGEIIEVRHEKDLGRNVTPPNPVQATVENDPGKYVVNVEVSQNKGKRLEELPQDVILRLIKYCTENPDAANATDLKKHAEMYLMGEE